MYASIYKAPKGWNVKFRVIVHATPSINDQTGEFLAGTVGEARRICKARGLKPWNF
jgi:hypothetical protein|tara:strand:+ start:82 stop:249 length:168 start_codon:yes stop_codon:yes gene_type:complete